MTHLYISTDASEAEELIEKTSIHSKPKYVYTDISSREGTKISKEIKRKMGLTYTFQLMHLRLKNL
jgi:predicted small metal-binding protein